MQGSGGTATSTHSSRSALAAGHSVYICGFQIWWRFFFSLSLFSSCRLYWNKLSTVTGNVSFPFWNHTHQSKANRQQQWQKCVFLQVPQTNMDALFLHRSTIILNIWMRVCSRQDFPFDGSYSSPPLCCSALAGRSVVTASLLMPLTGGYLLPYMFSLQLHHGRMEAAKPCRRDDDGHLFD